MSETTDLQAPHTGSGAKPGGRRIAWAVALLLLVFLGAGVAVGSTSAACASCHSMRPFGQSLAGGAHRNASCYSCHLANGAWDWPAFKFREITVMYPAAAAGRKPSGAIRETSSAACLKCHSRVMNHAIEARGLRINHSTCAVGGTCDTCHSTVAHGKASRWPRQPIMEQCIECHRAQGGPTACDSCHKGKGERERLATGPWQVTHGPTWQSTHGMGSLQYCDSCHPQDYCARCHGVPLPHGADFGYSHGQLAKQSRDKCLACHDKAALCDSCHGIEMPHPKGFLPAHSKIASSKDDPKCLERCHRVKDCVDCHTKHTHPGRTDGTLGKPPTGAIVGGP